MDVLRKEIEKVLEPVGFELGQNPDNLGVIRPDGASFWISSYAIVSLCPVPPSDADKRILFVDKCETWLEALATNLEKEKDGFLDAYLLLGLLEKPDENLLVWARESALSTRFSRKQVVWPQSSMESSLPPRTSSISVAEIPIHFVGVAPPETDTDTISVTRGLFPGWMLEILETSEKDVPSLAKQFLEGVEHGE